MTRRGGLRFSKQLESITRSNRMWALFWLATVLPLSLASAWLTGLLLYGSARGYVWYGLLNLGSFFLLGVYVNAMRGPKGALMRGGKDEKGFHRTGFCTVFTVVFMVLAGLVHLGLRIPIVE